MKAAPHSYTVSAGSWTFYAPTERAARLIADAHKLLDALEEARDEVVRLARGVDGTDDDLRRLDRWDALLHKHGR